MKNAMRKLMMLGVFTMAAGGAMAALTDTVVLTVTPVGNKSVSIDLANFDFGNLNLGTTGNLSSSATVTNDGNIVSTWGVRISAADGVWTADAAAAGADQYLLMALFNDSVTPPVSGDFTAANDNVTTAQVDASATAYAGNQSGLSVPVSGTRGLWFRLDMPTSSSVSTQRSFTVEIEAK
jgi:hypothetical protein